VYGIGFTAAATTSYLRMAADEHWLTDVLAGAAVGTAVGIGLPWLHRRAVARHVQLSPMRGGLALAVRFQM
jgi:membrane-associated phospholipid phosphatase